MLKAVKYKVVLQGGFFRAQKETKFIALGILTVVWSYKHLGKR
jgi:hypothetical protein